MRGDGEVDHASPMVGEHDEDEQQAAGGRRYPKKSATMIW
jgi:hypothetical protein